MRQNLEAWVEEQRTREQPQWHYLTSPLTSASWDGDARSTTAKTVIDLSAVFGVPANVKAVLVNIKMRDSAAATNDAALALGPTNTAWEGFGFRITGGFNDYNYGAMVVIPCDANGDIYYQTVASGAGTLDIWLEIYGYQL